MPTIEISDQGKTGLSFDLTDILGQIEPFADGLEWYFVEFELGSFHGAREGNVEPWVLALWHHIEESNGGVEISWETLKAFARSVRQSIFCLIVAVDAGAMPPIHPLDPNSPEFRVVVQAVDASFWAVTTSNASLITKLKEHFRVTEIVERTKLYY